MNKKSLLLMLASSLVSTLLYAQTASDSIRIIVPFAAGGPADQIARIISTPLAIALGKTTVVDNRGGAGGVIGVSLASKAPTDGNTLLLTTSSFVITAGITPNLSYNPRKDLEPVYLLGEVQTMLAVRNNLGVNTLAELITKAKGSNKLNYGSTGVGGTMHIGAELFGKAANVQVVHIPYKGAAPAITDLIAGTVDFVNADVPILRNYVKDNRIKALVIYDTKRSPLLPDVPTAVEAGLPNMLMSNWYGVLVPAGVSIENRKRIEEALAKVVKQPDVAAKLTDAGFMNPKDANGFKARLEADFDRWIPWLKEANIKAE
ncbi:MAG: Bug family tripartite tricarboxylate transporter substrate binding protein [Burkholderiaceae bacterium]|jgi:tripartite-type tricarboxylate transporter receptor subunit TctC